MLAASRGQGQAPSSDGTLGNAKAGSFASHSSYTGDLTQSTSEVPQIPKITGLDSPKEIRDETNKIWNDGGFSKPEVVKPQEAKSE